MEDINKNYLIYSDGRVYSLATHQFLRPMHAGNGRGFNIDIRYAEGTDKRRKWMINQLIYHYFIEKIDLMSDDYIIAHKDRNQANYSLDNLIKVSRGNYTREQMKRGIIKYHDLIPPVNPPKLNPKQDKAVYDLVNSGHTKVSLAKKHGVSEMSILRAYRRHETILSKKTIKTP